MTRISFLPGLLFAALLLGLGFFGCSARERLPAIDPPAKYSVDSARVAIGAQLAAMGNCMTCHTARGGKPYAGGLALKTPFGTVYGTNITPDPDTGIGRWSEADFARAMREGVDRAGRHLYPAFPYEYFTRLSNEDIGALYAFLMTREAVRQETPADRILIPRPLIAAWKALYFDRGAFQPDASQGAQWNRGAYLAQSLAHCSACHTPRNALGAEKKREYFSGGEAGGWHAPALNAESPSPIPWTAAALATYLRTGTAEAHAVTAGPMEPVVHNLKQVADDDVRAMANYIASLDTRSPAQRQAASAAALGAAKRPTVAGDPAISRGALIYAGACADCHDRGRGVEGGALPLPLASGLTLPTPRNLIHIIREGIVPAEGESGFWMPGYAGALTDAQLSDLVIYLRSLAGRPAWDDVPGEVRKITQDKP